MAVVLAPIGVGFQFFGGNTPASAANQPLVGGLLNVYAAGTTTPVTTYTSSSGLIANTNPIVLDASGRVPFEIWWTAGSSYKFVLQDSAGNTIPNGTWDNVPGINDLFPISAGSVTFTPPVTGGVATTVAGKLGQYVSLKDFGCVLDGVTDDTAALTTALNSGLPLFHPGGIALISSGINVTPGVKVCLYGIKGQSVIKAAATFNGALYNGMIQVTSATNFQITGINFNRNAQSAQTGPPNYDACLLLFTCSNFLVQNCNFTNAFAFGLIIGGGQTFWVDQCYFQQAYPSTWQNEGIYITDDSRISQDGHVTKNILIGTGMDLKVWRCEVSGNDVSGWNFGAGITTEQDSGNNAYYRIIGNVVHDGGTAIDHDATYPAAIENWAFSSVIANNVIYNIGSSGIGSGGELCTITGNYIDHCGMSGAIGVYGASIVSRYGSATYNGNGTTIIGNTLVDTNVSATTTYFYADENSSISRVLLGPNTYSGTPTLGMENVLGDRCNHTGPSLDGSLATTVGLLANGASTSYALTVTGAAFGDYVYPSCSVTISGLVMTAYVSNINQVTIIFNNNTGAGVTVGACTLRARVEKQINFAHY